MNSEFNYELQMINAKDDDQRKTIEANSHKARVKKRKEHDDGYLNQVKQSHNDVEKMQEEQFKKNQRIIDGRLLSTDVLVDKSAKRRKEELKRIMIDLQEFSSTIMQIYENNVNRQIDGIDAAMNRNTRAIEQQKILAERGLANDLAFEIKRQDELEKARLNEKKKLRKAKELEIFLNALAKFSETDPKTALPKAVGLLTATKIAETVYGEDGGIIGNIKSRGYVSNSTLSRTHKSGNDVLLQAEKGEGLLSVKDMHNIKHGVLPNWMSSMMKTPFNQKLIPLAMTTKDNSGAILSRLESLEATIKNKSEVHINFDELQNWITTEVKAGLKTVTTHKKRWM